MTATDEVTTTLPPSASGTAEHGGTTDAWRRVPWWLRGVVLVLAGVLVVELASGLAGSRTVPTASTSPSSTGSQGTAGLVRFLAARTTVRVATAPLGASSVPRGATLLVLDPTRWTAADRAVARGVAASGGRVVFVGAAPEDPGPVLGAGDTVTLRPSAVGPVTHTAPGRVTFGVTSLVTGAGSLSTTGAVRVDVAGLGGTFVASDGPVVWVASSVPLRNAYLATDDDAALAWNLAAPWGHGVVVDAADQVLPATTSGFRALPTWWFTALGIALLAVASWLASAGRRFGPLEARSRSLPPARAAHAEAMGALLAGRPRRGSPR